MEFDLNGHEFIPLNNLLKVLGLAGTGGEANIRLPNLNDARFLGDSIGGKDLLYSGLIVSALGIAFGLVVCSQVRKMPVHQSMRDGMVCMR